MQSIATHTYPQVVWREGQKMLWNPVRRKPLKNRPEERVRLRIIEYLLRAGWSKHRITTEEAVGKLADTAMRTDIICYNKQFKPRILVECKAENIPISEKTAKQVARYNQNVDAPYLLMSNGVADHWYKVDSGGVRALKAQPELITSDNENPAYDYEKWKQRGFAGAKAAPPLRKWFAEILPSLWLKSNPSHIRFLTFNQQLTDLNLSHYYYLESASEKQKVAVSTLTTAYGGSRLVGILNRNNQNKAVLEVNLDLVFDGKAKNSAIYSETGIQTIDGAGEIDPAKNTTTDKIVEQVRYLFEIYID